MVAAPSTTTPPLSDWGDGLLLDFLNLADGWDPAAGASLRDGEGVAGRWQDDCRAFDLLLKMENSTRNCGVFPEIRATWRWCQFLRRVE
jgi:hypothetical protein